MPEATPQPRAVKIDRLQPDELNIIAAPGETPEVEMHVLAGQVAPHVFMFDHLAVLPAEAAIAVGRELIARGEQSKRDSLAAKTGLVIGDPSLGDRLAAAADLPA